MPHSRFKACLCLTAIKATQMELQSVCQEITRGYNRCTCSGGSILGLAAVKRELGCSFVTCTCFLLSFHALTLNAVNNYTADTGLLECVKQMFQNSENYL